MELEMQRWRGIACCEEPALLFEAMVKSQSVLQLRAMFGSMVMQWQGSA